MHKFCFGCKVYIALPANDPYDAFGSAGHTNQPVKRLQRNLGRKQRPAEWQNGPRASV